ncbi:MAG: DUF5069 domain-containing protein [Verrucomicrobia bacterium]|nr:DUF5069 domain-containing protein [Verrucomicrobiota bacterium]
MSHTDPHSLHAPDLTKRPPRSMRARLGGFIILPRMLDKGRAEIAGTGGEYHYNCPLDAHFLNFVGIDPAALREQLALGKGDGEILLWIKEHATHKRTPWEIEHWSSHFEHRAPASVEQRDFFHQMHKELAAHRDDMASWADMLDLDDYVTFGGKP